MKARKHKLLAAFLAAAVASPCAAAPSLEVRKSTAPVSQSRPLIRLDFRKGAGPHGRASIGVKGGIKEGKPLQMLTWGAGGAVVGSLAGPFGAAVGGAAGVFVGLCLSIFVVPRTRAKDRRPD